MFWIIFLYLVLLGSYYFMIKSEERNDMDIRMRKENIIDDCDWDKAVKKVYGRPYAFQQQDGCRSRGVFRIRVPDEAYDYKQESIPEIVNHSEKGVSFAKWLERDPNAPLADGRADKDSLELWWERNFYPNIQMIANDLHNKGFLEKGCYTIDIDW